MTKHIAIGFFFILTAAACLGQSQPVSLGEVVKHRTPGEKAKLVVDDETISSFSGVISVVGKEPVRNDSAQAPVSDKARADQNPAGPSQSPAEITELKKQLEWRKSETDGWKRSAKHYEELLKTETDEFRRQTYETALANDRVNAERSQKQVDEAQAAVDKAQQAAADKQQKDTAAAVDKTQ